MVTISRPLSVMHVCTSRHGHIFLPQNKSGKGSSAKIIQALTDELLAPGVASTFACVFLLGTLGQERYMGAMAVGPVDLNRKKRGCVGSGGGRNRNYQGNVQAIAANPP